ncbi:MAG: hypothetical protein D3923_03640 [Candidatus Electrothrix sp. AR3]|nr:hypothetical protein [Candidatus Electrothrix sp. AR3]
MNDYVLLKVEHANNEKQGSKWLYDTLQYFLHKHPEYRHCPLFIKTMRVLKPSIFIIFSCFLLAETAQADYWWHYAKVLCEPVKQNLRIEIDTLWNEDPDLLWHGTLRPKSDQPVQQEFRVTSQLDYAECFIAPGKQVRIKMSEDKAKAYGACGADPGVGLSLWMNERKWLSRYQVAGGCTTQPVSRISVSPSGLLICWKKADEFGELLKDAQESCKTIARAELPEQPDLKEYPPTGVLQAEAGTIVLEQGKDSTLCNTMIRKKRSSFDRAIWSIVLPAEAERSFSVDQEQKPAGPYGKQRFDIDNDGTLDTVYSFHPAGRAMETNIFFVSSGKELDDRWSTLSVTDLREKSPFIFPHGCTNNSCDQGNENFILTGYGEHFGYPLSYLQAAPFVWQNTTYFLLTSVDSETEHIAVVVRPVKGQRPDKICIFRTVEENY